jgi:hypothetical protein
MDADYGYDLIMVTYNEDGEVENGLVFFQLKVTDHLRTSADGRTIGFSVTVGDLDLWTREELPVILIVYDAVNEQAYWIHIQGVVTPLEIPSDQETLTLQIPVANTVGDEAVASFRRLKHGGRDDEGSVVNG